LSLQARTSGRLTNSGNHQIMLWLPIQDKFGKGRALSNDLCVSAKSMLKFKQKLIPRTRESGRLISSDEVINLSRQNSNSKMSNRPPTASHSIVSASGKVDSSSDPVIIRNA
jgi:hypothetical protein